ncbi:hypothetical protein TELCIR_14082, partial [Teladorsagia circumcincta]
IDRAWMWQRCTEFGSFPTTDGGINSMFGSLVSLSPEKHCSACKEWPELTAADIRHQALTHEGPNLSFDAVHVVCERLGTNVVIANGGRDPWSLLSKLTSEDPSVVSYVPSSTPESFESGFFEQPVDHFDNQNPYTFNQ